MAAHITFVSLFLPRSPLHGSLKDTRTSYPSHKKPNTKPLSARLADQPPRIKTSPPPPPSPVSPTPLTTRSRKHRPNSPANPLYTNIINTPSTSPSSTPTQRLRHHRRLPVVGYLVDCLLDPFYHGKYKRKYGPIYTTDIVTRPVTVLADRHGVLSVLRDNGYYFVSENAYPKGMEEVFKTKLVSRDGESHARFKTLTKQAFRIDGDTAMLHGVNRTFQGLFQHFAELPDGVYEKSIDKFGETTFKAIIGITLGWDAVDNDVTGVDVVYMKELFNRVALSLFAPKLPMGLGHYGAGMRAKDELLGGIIRKVVEKRMKTHEEVIGEMKRVFAKERVTGNSKEAIVMVQTLLAAGKIDLISLLIAMYDMNEYDLDDAWDTILKSVLGFWFAGTETTANLLSSAVNELSMRPELLATLRREQDNLIEAQVQQGGWDPATVTSKQLEFMPLMDAFFNESCRIRGPSSTVFRIAARDLTVAGYPIKKGEFVSCDLKAAMEDVDLFPNPTDFRIDRYLRKSNPDTPECVLSQRRQATMLGFGGGAHFCTGAMLAKLEFKVALSHLLRMYNLEMDPTASPEYSAVGIFSPKSKVPFRLSKRA